MTVVGNDIHAYLVKQIEDERKRLRQRRIELYEEIARIGQREIVCIDALQELGAYGTMVNVRHNDKEDEK